ncbi:MAG: hypothetical protein LBO72_06045 [Helicobacteraceae bacterium]|jgi:hypothetical protein|nr:hypothetical protein [Helicobacteraceae bacterium]
MSAPAIIDPNITPEQLRAGRRQKYLNLEYYILNQKELDRSTNNITDFIQTEKPNN